MGPILDGPRRIAAAAAVVSLRAVLLTAAAAVESGDLACFPCCAALVVLAVGGTNLKTEPRMNVAKVKKRRKRKNVCFFLLFFALFLFCNNGFALSAAQLAG